MSNNETDHTVINDKVNDHNNVEVNYADPQSPTFALHKSPKATNVLVEQSLHRPDPPTRQKFLPSHQIL